MTSSITESDTQQIFGSQSRQPLLLVNTHYCKAIIALQGAQLLSFCPVTDQQTGTDWLWLSPKNPYLSGDDIIGGIPLCLPWFGRHPDGDKPIHGFAQKQPWRLTHVDEQAASIQLVFEYHYQGEQAHWFAHAFKVQQTLTLNHDGIKLTLNLQNLATQAIPFSWAWHSYLASPVETATITGLEQHMYLDNTQGLSSKLQTGPIRFTDELDRVYPQTRQPQTLSQLSIDGLHCPTCIIWNPGAALAQRMPMIANGFKDFICLERGCAFDDTITLQAQQTFCAEMNIRKHT